MELFLLHPVGLLIFSQELTGFPASADQYYLHSYTALKKSQGLVLLADLKSMNNYTEEKCHNQNRF